MGVSGKSTREKKERNTEQVNGKDIRLVRVLEDFRETRVIN